MNLKAVYETIESQIREHRDFALGYLNLHFANAYVLTFYLTRLTLVV
jgi:hypothetical protein